MGFVGYQLEYATNVHAAHCHGLWIITENV